MGDEEVKGIFPSQGSYQGLPHWREMLYPLSHQGSLLSKNDINRKIMEKKRNNWLEWSIRFMEAFTLKEMLEYYECMLFFTSKIS